MFLVLYQEKGVLHRFCVSHPWTQSQKDTNTRRHLGLIWGFVNLGTGGPDTSKILCSDRKKEEGVSRVKGLFSAVIGQDCLTAMQLRKSNRKYAFSVAAAAKCWSWR